VFTRDMNTGYCDLSRHEAEYNALLTSVDPLSAVITTRVSSGLVEKVLAPERLAGQKVRSWRECPPDENDAGWLALFDGDS